jgi:hypothetical protein
MDLITGQKRLKSRAAAKSANRDIPLLNAKNVTFYCALLPKTIFLKPSTPSENAPFYILERLMSYFYNMV